MNNFWKFTIIYGLGFLLLRGISFCLLPIYTNFLSQYNAGIIFLVYTILAFLNPVFAYGMNAALFKFYNSNFSKKVVLSTSFISLFVSSFVFCLILILFSKYFNYIIEGSLQSHTNWFLYIAIILFADSISSRAFVLLRLNEKPIYFLFVGLVNIVFSLTFNFFFIKYLSLGAVGAVYALALVSVIQMILLLPSIIPYLSLANVSYELLMKMFQFGLPFLPSALLFVIVGFSDRWLIKFFLNVDAVGVYGTGYKLGSIMSLAVTAFNLNWQPYYLKQNDTKMLENIGSYAILGFVFIFTALIFVVDILVFFNINNIYLIGENFREGIVVVPYIALGYFFYGIYILQSPSIFLKNKQNWGMCFWIIAAALNIILNIIMIPKYGIVGAGIASALSYFIMMLLIIKKNKEWFPMHYRMKPISIYTFISLCFLLFKKIFVLQNLPLLIINLGLYVMFSLYAFSKIRKDVISLYYE